MIDLLVAENHYASQAWLHLEAGDPGTAKTWADLGWRSARARRNGRADNPCLLLLALAMLSLGDADGERWLGMSARGFDGHCNWLGAGVALICLALVDDHRRLSLLESADVHLERAMRGLAQAGDTDRWRRVKAIRARAANDADALLPSSILYLDSIA